MKNTLIIGSEAIDPITLALMQSRGGEWYAYQNHDLGHPQLGHLKFLKCGPDCTCKHPPQYMPDTETEINWRYILVGKVDLSLGRIL
jgi:hypothetical protein